MSQMHWSVVLLTGGCGADGLFDFQRTVLMEPAVQHMMREIPSAWHTITLEDRTACETAGLTGPVMLFEKPVPELTAQDYFRLADLFFRRNTAVVTVRDCTGEPVGILCDAADLSQGQTGDAAVDLTETAVISMARAYEVQCRIQKRTAHRLMENGVCIMDPDGTWIAADAVIGAGSCILPGTMIYPGCRIGRFCTIGPNTVLKQTEVDDRTEINASQIAESTVGADSAIGPFAYIRPGCRVGDRTRIGDFVELKNAVVGDDTKASHLTYIGDADVGNNVNFGCGTVVVNYDGYEKHRTAVGDNCFIGCNTNLVAPVRLGDRVLTAAGSTITDDVPDGAMAVARARQKNKLGWNDARIDAHRSDR